MKKTEPEANNELRSEYELRILKVRKIGPARKRFGDVIRLEPDVAEAFPDAESVDKALRSLIQVSKD